MTVSLSYDDVNSHLTYATYSPSAQTTNSFINVNSQELGKAYPDKCNLSVNGTFGQIVRSKPTDSYEDSYTFQDYAKDNPTTSAKLGDYVYVYLATISPCRGDGKSQPQQQAETALKSIFQ